MKNAFLLALSFYSYSLFAQEYVMDGVKDRFLFGIVSVANDNLAVLYKSDKQIQIVTLDDNMKSLGTANMDIDLHPKDKIADSWYNGKSLLLSVNKYKGTVSNPPYYIGAATYEKYYVTVGNDNIQKGILSANQSALLFAQAVIADPAGKGYYFLSGDRITKLDNSLKRVWIYKLPKSHTLAISGPSSFAIFGGFNLYQVDESGVVFVMKKTTGLKQKLEDEELVALSSDNGSVRFNNLMDISDSKVFYKLNERRGHYFLSGFLGTSTNMGSNTLTYNGTYQMEVDPAGKVIAERKHLSPELNDLIFKDNAYHAYLRNILLTNTGGVIVFEEAFEDKFLVFDLDTDFAITQHKLINREHSDLKDITSAYVSMFLGKKYNAAKLMKDDYVTTVPAGNNNYYLMYEQLISSWTEGDAHNYRSSVVSFDNNVNEVDKMMESWKEKYAFFTSPQLFYTISMGSTGLIMAYTEPKDKKLIVKRIPLMAPSPVGH